MVTTEATKFTRDDYMRLPEGYPAELLYESWLTRLSQQDILARLSETHWDLVGVSALKSAEDQEDRAGQALAACATGPVAHWRILHGDHCGGLESFGFARMILRGKDPGRPVPRVFLNRPDERSIIGRSYALRWPSPAAMSTPRSPSRGATRWGSAC